MLEIIILYFITKHIGALARQKGLKPSTWKIYTILAWFAAEIIGIGIGFNMFGKSNLLGIVGIGLFCAFGGYLLVKYNLENKPDYFDEEDDRIGVDELGPQK